jgi:hypothetical protein
MISREPEQVPQPIESERVQQSVTGPMLVLVAATLLGVLAVADAFVLDAIFGEFPRFWLGLILVLELGLVAAAFALRPDLRPHVRWSPLEIVGTVMVGAAFLAHALYLAPSDLMPTSFSVDCPHQHLLVNYIYQTDSFPDDVSYLYIYDDYPVAASAWAAFGARLLGVLPARTMYPLAALMVAAQVMLVYGICIELLPRRPSSHAIAAMAALSVFLPYQYSVGAFTEWFFSNMILGDLLVVLTLWLITVREKLHPAVSFVALLLLAFGCLNSYPAWAPFVLVPGLASIVLDRRMTIRRRLATAGLLAVLVAALTLIAVLDQWDFITWFAPVRDRRLLPGWESLGGLFLIPVLGGVWIAARAWKRVLGFALFLVVDLALVAALYAVALLDKLALYIPDKTFYFNVFVLAVLAALSLNWLWERLLRSIAGRARKPAAPAQAAAQPGKRSTAGSPRRPGWQKSLIVALGLVAICVAVVAVVNWRHPAQSFYPITLDEYRVGYDLAEQMPDAEVAFLVRSHATFYWIYGSLLNRTHDVERQSQLWQADPPTYDGWIADPTSPSIAIVSDLTSIPQDGQWRPIIRSGNSAAIERTR